MVVKDQERAKQKASLQRDIEKLSGTVEIANKFNLANDNAIRRLQEGLELYKTFTADIEERIGRVDSAVQHRRDRQGPPSREETSLEGLRLQFDNERHLDHLKTALERVLAELEELRQLKQQHETLVASVQLVSQQLTPLDASLSIGGHNSGNEGVRLRQAYATFVLLNEDRLSALREEVDLLNRFVRGRLPSPEVPDELRDLHLVPHSEKEALEQRIEELEKELASRAEVKGVRKASVSNSTGDRSEASGSPAAAPSQASRKSQPTVQGIPFSYHSKRTPRDPKPKLDARANNGKPVSTRVVNF